MKPFKFKYPDIPYIIDRSMYDYMFSLDRLVREQGDAINKLVEVINAINSTTKSS